MIDLCALRLAPSPAAGLIAYSHMRRPGDGLIVFACVLIASTLAARSGLPLQPDAGEPGHPRARRAARRASSPPG